MRCSVIVPVYNVPNEFLRKCFSSLRRQSLKEMEYIIIDDGSNLSTANMCDEFCSNELRAKVIHQENQGLAGARNTGLACAIGEYVIFLDSDDWFISDDVCEKMVDFCDREDFDIVFFAHKKINCYRKIDKSIKDLIAIIIRKEDVCSEIQIASAWGKIFKRRFLVENSILFDKDLRRTQDRLFMIDCLSNNPRYAFNDMQVLHFNLMNEGSLSRKCDMNNIKYLQMFYNKCCKHIEEKYDALEFASDFKLLCDKLYLEICVHSFFHPDNNERNFKIFKEFTSEYKKNNGWEWDTTDEINILDRSIVSLAKNNKFRMVYVLFVIRMYLMVIRKRMKV